MVYIERVFQLLLAVVIALLVSIVYIISIAVAVLVALWPIWVAMAIIYLITLIAGA